MTTPPHLPGFEPGRDLWLARLGNLRNIVRQHVVATQIDAAVADLLPRRELSVLDVGAGQGTQALRLAQHGHLVHAVDVSPAMLEPFRSTLADEDDVVRDRVTLGVADVLELPTGDSAIAYDLVLCGAGRLRRDDLRHRAGAGCPRGHRRRPRAAAAAPRAGAAPLARGPGAQRRRAAGRAGAARRRAGRAAGRRGAR